MARHLVLGNGNILVGLDEHARIRDFYFPHVGLENHVGGQIHKFGIWANGKFSWFDSYEWHKKLDYIKDSLVTDVLGKNDRLQIELHINDTISYHKNIYLRKVLVTNKAPHKQDVKVFFHQLFNISESNIGDTVYYNPIIEAIVHYKGKRYFLINGIIKNKKLHGISNYATGLSGEYGKEGTYVDAEDGHLSNNPIEHGSVDSTISFEFSLEPGQSATVYYWICVGVDFREVTELNQFVEKQTPEKVIKKTEQHWINWVNRTEFNFMGLSKDVIDLFKRSLLIIRTHVDNHGAIIASCDSDLLFLKRDTYNYMWPRDGALIARSLDRAGYSDITESFFKFCIQSLTPEGYLLHKYRSDGSLGSSWHSWLKEGRLQLPIQEDQLGLILDAFWKHYLQHSNITYVRKYLDSFVRKAGAFLLSYIDKKTDLPLESYDLWEERLGVHTFTACAVYAGLRAVSHFEMEFGDRKESAKFKNAAEKMRLAILKYMYDPKLGYFIKGTYYKNDEMKKDTRFDASSAYAVFQFKVLPPDDERIVSSFEFLKKHLKAPIGGYARYQNDDYHRVSKDVPGNPWFITTLWLAEWYIAKAQSMDQLKPAIDILDWVAKHALETGVLAEQMNPFTGEPLSVAPLTWSHAAFVVAVNKYLERLDTLGLCEMCNPPKIKFEEE